MAVSLDTKSQTTYHRCWWGPPCGCIISWQIAMIGACVEHNQTGSHTYLEELSSGIYNNLIVKTNRVSRKIPVSSECVSPLTKGYPTKTQFSCVCTWQGSEGETQGLTEDGRHNSTTKLTFLTISPPHLNDSYYLPALHPEDDPPTCETLGDKQCPKQSRLLPTSNESETLVG